MKYDYRGGKEESQLDATGTVYW